MRPHLEHCSTVWDPYTKANIKKLEMVQRRAARYILNRFRNISSVGEMLTHLNWTSLVTHRHHAKLTMMYKMINGLAAVYYQQYIIPVERKSRHMASHCFQTLHSHTNYHCNLFFPRTGTIYPRSLPRPYHCPPSEDGWPTIFSSLKFRQYLR